MKLKSLLPALLIVFTGTLYGQKDTTNSKTYNVTYSSITKKENVEYSRLIKINPILFLVGDMPIYFEQKLTDIFSAEIGAGVTYFDYFGSNYSLFDADFSYFDYDIYPEFGYSFRLNLKYYPSFILDEWYFGFGYQHKKYFATLEEIDTGNRFAEEKTINDFRIIIGYVYYFTDKVFADMYGTMGIRDSEIRQGATIFPSKMPAVGFGVKFGFAL